MRVDYDATAPTNQPDVTSAGALGASWDTASWDTASWGGTPVMWINWQGVSGLGRVGAPRMTAYIVNCSFALSGWDVLYETGSVFG
jgi:hypothetical protein